MGGGIYDASHAKQNLQIPTMGQIESSPSTTPKRPQLEARGFTERTTATAESPKLLAADQTDDSVQGVLLRSMSDMN